MTETRKSGAFSKFFRKQILNLPFLDRRLFTRELADNQEEKLCPYEKLDHLYELGRERSDSLCSAPSSPSIGSHRMSRNYLDLFSVTGGQGAGFRDDPHGYFREGSPLRSERSLSAPSSPSLESAYYEAIPLLEGFYDSTHRHRGASSSNAFSTKDPNNSSLAQQPSLPADWMPVVSTFRSAGNSMEPIAPISGHNCRPQPPHPPPLPPLGPISGSSSSSRRYLHLCAGGTIAGSNRHRRRMMMLYHQAAAAHPSRCRGGPSPVFPSTSSSGRQHRPRNLKDLLERLNLKLLLPLLMKHGVTTLATFKDLTASRLTEMGIHDIQSRVKVLTAIDLLSDDDDIPEEADESLNQQNASEYGNGSVSRPLLHSFSVAGAPGPSSSAPQANNKKDKSTNTNDKNKNRSGQKPGNDPSGRSKPSVKFTETLPSKEPIMDEDNLATPTLPKDMGLLRPTQCPPLVSQQLTIQTQQLNSIPLSGCNFPSFYSNTISLGRSSHQPGNYLLNTTSTVTGGQLHPNSAFQSLYPGPPGAMPTSSLSPSTDQNATAAMGRPPTRAEVVFTANLELRLKDMLDHEGILLTSRPYSGEGGESGIPLRLIERYADELQQNVQQVALILEKIREELLREENRPLVSNMEDVLNHRFLNCVGISTDTLENFLTSIGLPQYVRQLSLLNNQPQDSSSSSSATSPAISPASVILTPRDLVSVCESDLVHRFGIHPHHVKYIQQESWLVSKSITVNNGNSTNSNNVSGSNAKHHRHHHRHHSPATATTGKTKSHFRHNSKTKATKDIGHPKLVNIHEQSTKTVSDMSRDKV